METYSTAAQQPSKQGGPGMPEMLGPGGALIGAGLGKDVPLVTDGRFSGILPMRDDLWPALNSHTLPQRYVAGASHGIMVGHVVPEAACGGPIALVQDGDTVNIDLLAATLDVDVSP